MKENTLDTSIGSRPIFSFSLRFSFRLSVKMSISSEINTCRVHIAQVLERTLREVAGSDRDRLHTLEGR